MVAGTICLWLLSTAIAQSGPADTMWAKVTFYDFHADGSNPEFNPDHRAGVYKGMVRDTLSPDRKPLRGPNPFFSQNIDKWFRPWEPGDFKVPVYQSNGRLDRTINASYDTAFKNITIEDSLPFLHIGDGVYLFERSGRNSTEEFFWIDGKGFGNEPEGYNHNYSFTMELHSYFTYRQGLRFEFLGDDDVWAFVNNHLVLDLGGIHTAQAGTVDMDSIGPLLGLVDGEVYQFDFFYAERHVTNSHIKITTNMITRADVRGPVVRRAVLKPSAENNSKDTLIISFNTPILCEDLFEAPVENSFVYKSDGNNLLKGSSYSGTCKNKYINSVKILVDVSSNILQQNDSLGFRKGSIYVTDPEGNHPTNPVKVKVEVNREASIEVTGYPTPASPDKEFDSRIRAAYGPVIGNNKAGALIGFYSKIPLQLVPGTDYYGTADIYDGTANLVQKNLPLKSAGTTGVYGVYWNIKNRNKRIVGNGTYLVVIKAKFYDGENTEKRIKIAVSR